MPKKQTPLDFLNKFKKSDINNEYELISDYVDSKLKIEIKHKKCGTVYMVLPYHFINGQRCVKCGKYSDRGITHNEFIKKYSDLYSGYEILSKYNGSRQKIKLRHLSCNNIVEISPAHFKKGRRCRFCSISNSKMEAMVEAYFYVNSVKYKKEHTFIDCISRRGRLLPFDFLVSISDSDFFLIECDGSQHYNEKRGWYNERNLENDSIKDEYSLNNGIKLIRIREDQIKDLYSILDVHFPNSEYPTYSDIDKFYSRKINFQKASEIRRRYLSGESGDSLASEFGVSRLTITKILNYTDFSEFDLEIKEEIMKKIKSKRKSLKLYKMYNNIDEIRSMINDGKSLREIGRFFKCSHHNIRCILKIIK